MAMISPLPASANDRETLRYRARFASSLNEVEPAPEIVLKPLEAVRARIERPVVQDRDRVTGDVVDTDGHALRAAERQREARLATTGIRRHRSQREHMRREFATDTGARDRIEADRLLQTAHVVQAVGHDLAGVVDVGGGEQEPAR